ncbi:MAG: cell division protein ZapA [Thermoanaerobacterales bacterium]|nr:cell division protein ZapA [Thermoanaerobacterales bacterium]
MQKETGEKINRLKVRINGEDYYKKGAASTDYIKQVALYVDKKISSLSKNHPQLSMTKITILAALNITDELFKMKQEYEEFLAMLESEQKG